MLPSYYIHHIKNLTQNGAASSSEVKHGIIIRPNNPTPRYMPRELKVWTQTGISTPMFIATVFTMAKK